MKRSKRLPLIALLAGAALVVAFAECPAGAAAATGEPRWSIGSLAAPTDFSTADNAATTCRPALGPQSCDIYYATATDVGAARMKAKAVTIEDTLPPGIAVSRVSLYWSGMEGLTLMGEQEDLNQVHKDCSVTLPQVKCTIPASFFVEVGRSVRPDDTVKLEVVVRIEEPATPWVLTNTAKVEGGGAPAAETSATNTLEEGAPAFGPALFTSPTLGADGNAATQAGSHPYELPTDIGFDSEVREEAHGEAIATSVEDPRDILVDLPPGMAGSALSTPRLCTFAELASSGAKNENNTSDCPAESQIGYIRTYPIGIDNARTPIYNLVPEHGVPAEFGYVDVLGGTHVLYASLVPSPQGYLLRTSSREIPQVQLISITTDIYGDPATREGAAVEPHLPTLTNPADCSGQPLVTQIHMDSWQHPGAWEPDGEPVLSEPNWVTKSYESPPVGGCDALEGHFAPSLEAHPTTNQGDSPSGLEVTLKVPQDENTETLATPPLKKAVVTLPAGMTVNPSSANGLEGCSLAQIGVGADGQPNAEPVRCPDASKIGKLELRTPALPDSLEGQVYVAKQAENPFGGLLAIYLVVDDPKTGVLVKIPGEVRADPQTGQLTTVIDNSPQFPFSELKTTFFGGQKAALRTPSVCGKYEVTSTLTPWSAPESGPPAEPAGSFEITGGCAPSPTQEPNQPSFEAGTLSPLAGAYSPFVLKLHREDGSQELSGLSVTLPEGLLGKLAGIAECPEAQIAVARSREHEGGGGEELASPSCPPASEVGTVTVGAGAGLTPYFTSGRAYLAGPYMGAPLSLAIITPAVAGPYDLGDVVVRTALEVDPYSARITAVSDPIPHLLQGIPLDVRSINLQMNRPQFTLNPTSCEAMTVGGTASTVLGQSALLSNRFQVGGCKALGFKPKLQLSLKGSTTRAKHPALKAVLTYPKGAYANIAYAQVGLPHSEFLDQGHIGNVCLQAQLASNTCPPASVYGRVKAWSPLLEKPLEGNLYLGVGFGHKLPDLVGELNGQIRILIHGKVDTDKEDGLRTTFETVPDAPVSKFILEMRGGRKKGLLRNSENLCEKPQRAEAKFVGQNGKVAVFRPLIANGCGGKKGGGRHRHHGRR
ncbi:MAG: hypothetical protein ACTHO8_05120 [Solirubrobacterales bacterium]